MSVEKTTCRNCDNIYAGNFCNRCGQKASTHRITWKHMIHDVTHAMFHLDKGIIHSAKELAFQPGQTIKDYLDGKRVNHFNPLLMLLLVGGFCSYLYGMTNLRTLFSPLKIHDLETANPFVAHKYFAISMSLGCVVFTLGDYFISWSRKYTFPELLVGNAFICGEILLFQILMIPFFMIGRQLGINEYIRLLCIALIFLYVFDAKYQFFKAANNRLMVTRLVVAMLLMIIVAYLVSDKVIRPMFMG